MSFAYNNNLMIVTVTPSRQSDCVAFKIHGTFLQKGNLKIIQANVFTTHFSFILYRGLVTKELKFRKKQKDLLFPDSLRPMKATNL